MELKITTRNLEVSDRFKEYVHDRSAKVEQLSHRPQELNIKVTRHEHNRNDGAREQVELTVYEPGHVVRAEARAEDKFAAFDLAFGKLLERLRRYGDKHKTQQVHRGGNHRGIGVSELTANDFADLDIKPVTRDVLEGVTGEIPVIVEEDMGESPVVIRRKSFESTPMSVEQALDHMELVGHDFYLFEDSETGKASVVYRRTGWNYGVLTLS